MSGGSGGDDEIIAAVVEVVRAKIGEFDGVLEQSARRLAALEQRLGELAATVTELRESRATMLLDCYAGIWSDAKDYARGTLCTHAGGLWLAVRDPAGSRPGEGPCWSLIVKSGKPTSAARRDRANGAEARP